MTLHPITRRPQATPVRTLGLAVPAALILTLAGCGGSSASPADRAASATTAASSSATEAPLPSTASDPSAPAPAPASASARPTALATVPSAPVTTRAPVPQASPAIAAAGVSLSVVSTTSVTSKATGVGEISGAPAIAVALKVTNRTRKPLSLANVIVNLSYGSDATPASPVGGSQTKAFTGRLKAGASASATYVFGVPKAGRDRLDLTVAVTPGQPIVAFRLNGN